MSWIDAIGSATKALAVPYGYTLTMWAAGMLAVTKYGHPSLWNILGFRLRRFCCLYALRHRRPQDHP